MMKISEEAQTAIINAIERAKSLKMAAGSASYEYEMGYNQAKQDVLIEIAMTFAEINDAA